MIDLKRGMTRFRYQTAQVIKNTRRLKIDAQQLVDTDGVLIHNLAKGYNVLILKNISSRKYPDRNSSPSDYNPIYLQWKIDNYGHTEPWHLTGDGVQRIRIFKDGNVRKVGIPRGIYDRGGKSWLNDDGSRKYGEPREITWYMAKLEYGDLANNQPPRPVFTPTLEDFYNGENVVIVKRYTTPMFRKWEVR